MYVKPKEVLSFCLLTTTASIDALLFQITLGFTVYGYRNDHQKKHSMQNTAGPLEPRGQGDRRQVTPQDVGHVVKPVPSKELELLIAPPGFQTFHHL